MGNSNLVDIVIKSPHHSGERTHKIDTISPHCVVGQITAENLGNYLAKPSTKASCNYGIGKDGKVLLCVDEKNRSWCTSSNTNDQRAVTIECASDSKSPYAFNDIVYDKLINLCVDICKRNGKNKLLWLKNKDTSLNYKPKDNEMILTVHRWFANKSCVPITSEVLTPFGWKVLSDIKKGDIIATVLPEKNFPIIFDKIEDIIEPYLKETVTCQNFTATEDHRMLYFTSNSPDIIKFKTYEELLKSSSKINRLPLAGQYREAKGLELSFDLIKFLIAVQSRGSYIEEKNTHKKYGINFSLKEKDKDKLKTILNGLNFKYFEDHNSIKLYNQKNYNIIDLCEKWLNVNDFTWDWIELSPKQAKIFLNEISLWHEHTASNSYLLKNKINRDIVNAIAVFNGVSCNIYNDTICFKNSNNYGLNKKNAKFKNPPQRVSCVTVNSGAFVCRQNGNVFLIGNCPGDWMFNKMQDLADKVTNKLNNNNNNSSTSTSTSGVNDSNTYPKPPFTVEVIINDLNLRKTPNGAVKDIVKKGIYTISEIQDNWGKLKSGAGWIFIGNPKYCIIKNSIKDTSINEKFLVKVTADVLNIRKQPGTAYTIVGTITDKGVYTIVETKNGFGKLSSGRGWICLDYVKKL